MLCSNVIKFVKQEFDEIVRYLPDQEKCGCLSNCRSCADCAQNLQWPAPDNVVHSRIYTCSSPNCTYHWAYNNPSANLATGVAYVDGRTGRQGSAGKRRRGRTTCADRLRAWAKGKGAARRVAYGGRPSHNRAREVNRYLIRHTHGHFGRKVDQ